MGVSSDAAHTECVFRGCPTCQSSQVIPAVCFTNLLLQSQCSVEHGAWGSQLAWEVGKEHLYCYHIALRARQPRGLLEGRYPLLLPLRLNSDVSCPPVKAEKVAGGVSAGAEV